ncbi:hypothetical protein CAPTEDRAFT_89450 [Capitella teleta]|uniref:CDK-activating kinase assembly factor MAT1 n=1 Tax=Capitella teleta TaxID=283909 RepID=R7THV1_CAPTE|nr:hypothetical protein CAPTEDRAFT_89450 [Capitella teleta]|eukprot:ELT91136.1 hypothetical protein CAPTEDRAFT_89450 [Capitella teleta]
MSDLACPRCKTTKYRNPDLKLMVNVCGHSLCENCVDLLFVRGSGSCLECSVPLRRNNFRLQMFEDSYVEKETDIRKKILKDFNKKEEDFSSLREFNDYLEDVETIVFNLTNGIDLEETKRKVELYKKEHQDSIRKNRAKMSKEEEELEDMIATEREIVENNRNIIQAEINREKKQKLKQKEALIDDLMFSDLPANHIVATHQQEVSSQKIKSSELKTTKFSTGISMGKRDAFLPIKPVVEGKVFTYSPLTIHTAGPDFPPAHDIQNLGYLSHIRAASDQERAGGYEASLACERALQEAFCGLYLTS